MPVIQHPPSLGGSDSSQTSHHVSSQTGSHSPPSSGHSWSIRNEVSPMSGSSDPVPQAVMANRTGSSDRSIATRFLGSRQALPKHAPRQA
jgi:hypothetical protein